jgi:hypothetical protein
MSQASENWWIGINVAAVLSAFFRAEPQTDWQRRKLAITALPLAPYDLLEYGDAICSHCGHEIDSMVCHCGESLAGHSDHSFVPMGCTCGYHDAPLRAVIPPIVPGFHYSL